MWSSVPPWKLPQRHLELPSIECLFSVWAAKKSFLTRKRFGAHRLCIALTLKIDWKSTVRMIKFPLLPYILPDQWIFETSPNCSSKLRLLLQIRIEVWCNTGHLGNLFAVIVLFSIDTEPCPQWTTLIRSAHLRSSHRVFQLVRTLTTPPRWSPQPLDSRTRSPCPPSPPPSLLSCRNLCVVRPPSCAGSSENARTPRAPSAVDFAANSRLRERLDLSWQLRREWNNLNDVCLNSHRSWCKPKTPSLLYSRNGVCIYLCQLDPRNFHWLTLQLFIQCHKKFVDTLHLHPQTSPSLHIRFCHAPEICQHLPQHRPRRSTTSCKYLTLCRNLLVRKTRLSTPAPPFVVRRIWKWRICRRFVNRLWRRGRRCRIAIWWIASYRQRTLATTWCSSASLDWSRPTPTRETNKEYWIVSCT